MSASIFRPRLEAMRATNAHHAERQTREFEQSAALRDCRNRASRRVMDDRKSKDESMQTSHAQRSERSSDNGVQSAIGKYCPLILAALPGIVLAGLLLR